jgi:peptidyl-prolyl cis-trans isomerase C
MNARRALFAAFALALVVGACSRPERGSGPTPASGSASATPDPARPLPSPVPDVVARVNGQPIRLAQILPLAREELNHVSVKDRDARRPAVLRHALERYIDRELLLQEALTQGVQADTRAVDWAYDQARREHPDDEAWAEYLADRGLDPQSLREELRVQHTVSTFLEQVGNGFPVSDEEARAAYEKDPASFGVAGAHPPDFERDRDKVRTVLRVREREKVADALIARLRARARIETFL